MPFLQAARLALEANPRLPYNPTAVLVQFDLRATESHRAWARQAIGGPAIYRYSIVPGLELVGTTLAPELAVKVLSGMPGVVYAELDHTVWADLTPNDPSFSSLWGLHNTGQSGGTVDADIDAPEAWDHFTGESSMVVGIVDTGIQLNHVDLAANIWTNPDEIAGNGVDDDGNGYIDDMNGWDWAYGDNNPSDVHSHGSHTAGTVGAVGNNGLGVVGVNWRVKLAALKFLNDSGSGSTSNAILAVNYAVGKGMRVTNNSWGGGGYNQSLYNAIQSSQSIGHLFCASAGNSNRNNDSTPHYPSSYNLPNIISVAATTRNDLKASFSNYGATTVDVGAPGDTILSTVPTNSYGNKSGTSMAAPHVSGVAAMIYAYSPTATWQQVRDAIFNTVRPISALAGRTVTGGVVNLSDALLYPALPPRAPANAAVQRLANGVIRVTWQDRSLNETGFELEREVMSRSVGGWGLTVTLQAPANATTYNDPTRGSPRYRVRAKNASGVSLWSNWAYLP
jgi:subtilisin family serine protease